MRIFLGLLLLLSACSSSSIRRTVAAENDLQFLNIEVQGASNSAGSGATLPLLARLRDHLIVSIEDKVLNDSAAIATLTQKRILIAADYFFPTNFPQLTKDSKTVRSETEEMMSLWVNSFDIVMVGLLPTWEELEPNVKQFVKDTDFGGYKNILDILEQYKTNVSVVNNVIKSFANNSKVKVLRLDKMISVSMDQFDGKQILHSFPIPPSPFNADKLHFTDAGQAFFLNVVVFPELNEKIPPIISTGKVSKTLMARALKTILKSKDYFLRGEDGGYWVEFNEPKQFLKENARINGESLEIMKPIMKIVSVINDNAFSRPGFPIFIQTSEGISLDLSSALFYTKIGLKEITEGIYEGWGYDYWRSADLFNPLNPPRVNYRFRLSSGGTPDSFLLEWTLFPLAKGQPTDLARLNYLKNEFIQDIKKSKASVTYKIQIQVKDL